MRWSVSDVVAAPCARASSAPDGVGVDPAAGVDQVVAAAGDAPHLPHPGLDAILDLAQAVLQRAGSGAGDGLLEPGLGLQRVGDVVPPRLGERERVDAGIGRGAGDGGADPAGPGQPAEQHASARDDRHRPRRRRRIPTAT